MGIFSALGRLVSGSASVPELPPFELRVVDDRWGDSNEIEVKAIQTRGCFPVNQDVSNAAFVISVFDVTDGGLKPVFTPIETFQENETHAYGFQQRVGDVSALSYFEDWRSIGFVVPEVLQTPRGGHRTLRVLVRIVSLDDPLDIRFGFGDSGLWADDAIEFKFFHEDKGYEEAHEDRDEARALTVKLGMAIALSDGELSPLEGKALKDWVTQEINGYEDDERDRLKALYNDAMKEAYDAASKSALRTQPITEKLCEIAEKNIRLEAIELCYHIMNADGQIKQEEINLLRKISNQIDLEPHLLESLRAKHLANLDSDVALEVDEESIVGILPSWTNDQKLAYLKKEFNKWNARLNSLPNEAQRKQAQLMINRITLLVKRYE